MVSPWGGRFKSTGDVRNRLGDLCSAVERDASAWLGWIRPRQESSVGVPGRGVGARTELLDDFAWAQAARAPTRPPGPVRPTPLRGHLEPTARRSGGGARRWLVRRTLGTG